MVSTTLISFIWNGSSWESIDVLGFWATRNEVLGIGAPIIVEPNAGIRASLGSTHDDAHGVVGMVDNGSAYVVVGGIVSGYSGLTPGQRVYVDESGGLRHGPIPSTGAFNAMLDVGFAVATDKIMVQPKGLVYAF